jgi:thymidylate synthase
MKMNNNVDKQYFELLERLLNKGNKKGDRTGTGTLSVFEHSMRFNMSEGFPLLTSKKMFTKGVVQELIWFLKGDTDIKYLIDNNVHIWDGDCYKKYVKLNSLDSSGKWSKPVYDHFFDCYHPESYSKEEFIDKIKTDDEFAKRWGGLGPIYGAQWRAWYNARLDEPIDQIKNLINDIKNDPDSRRLIVSAWNVAEIDQMTLPPCHYVFQCYTRELSFDERIDLALKSYADPFDLDIAMGNAENVDEMLTKDYGVPTRALSLKWTQRSVDTFLGLPFNIASYALLLELLAKEVNMIADELIFSGGDVHLYINHIEQAKEQLNRETFELSKLILKNKSLEDLKFEDIEIVGYKSAPILKGDLSN